MLTRQLLLSLSLLLLAPSVVFGEAHCPGNLETLRYHLLSHSRIGVSVSINRSGPYEFLLDTGSQITILEPSLAAELQLSPEGTAGLTSGVRRTEVQLVRLDLAQVGPYSVEQPLAAVQSLGQIQVSDPVVRGILGENFLTRFDVLIDHAHRILCFDSARQMQNELHGERIPLLIKSDADADSLVPQPLLIPVGMGDPVLLGKTMRQMTLRIDSGANVPQLFVNTLDTASWKQRQNALQGQVIGESSQFFAFMPAQDIHIGKHVVESVFFATPVKTGHDVAFHGEDGLLPTGLFKRVFISYAGRFVILDPR